MSTKIKTFVGQNPDSNPMVDINVNKWLMDNEGKKKDQVNKKEIEITILDIKIAAASKMVSSSTSSTEVAVTIIYNEKEIPLSEE